MARCTPTFHSITFAILRCGSTVPSVHGAGFAPKPLPHDKFAFVGIVPKIALPTAQLFWMVVASEVPETFPFCRLPGPGTIVPFDKTKLAPVGTAQVCSCVVTICVIN